MVLCPNKRTQQLPKVDGQVAMCGRMHNGCFEIDLAGQIPLPMVTVGVRRAVVVIRDDHGYASSIIQMVLGELG